MSMKPALPNKSTLKFIANRNACICAPKDIFKNIPTIIISNSLKLEIIQMLIKSPWRRARLPTPVFWPGEFQGLYSPWGCEESDTTERLLLYYQQ